VSKQLLHPLPPAICSTDAGGPARSGLHAPPAYRPTGNNPATPNIQRQVHQPRVSPPVYRCPSPTLPQAPAVYRPSSTVALMALPSASITAQHRISRPMVIPGRPPAGMPPTVQRSSGVVVPAPAFGPERNPAHSTKAIREQAKKNWERMEQYELAWGYYPWQRPTKPASSEYRYEPDPKQQAQDRLEYIKAVHLLRREAEIDRMIQANSLARQMLQYIDPTDKESIRSFRMAFFLHSVAPQVQALMDRAGSPEERKQIARYLVTQWEEEFERQIVDESKSYVLERGERCASWLKSLWESLVHTWPRAKSERDRTRLMRIFDYSQGYARSLNDIQLFQPEAELTVESVLSGLLNKYNNTSIFTQRGDSRPTSQQIKEDFSKYDEGSNEYFAFWGAILGALGMKFGYWEKAKIMTLVQQNRVQISLLLSPLLPPGAVDRFLLTHLKKACKRAGMY